MPALERQADRKQYHGEAAEKRAVVSKKNVIEKSEIFGC